MQFYIQLLANGLSTGSIYAIIAVGYTLIFSILKFSNFSHGGVMVVSAYIAYIIASQLTKNLWLLLPLTGLFGGLINMLVEFVGFHRLRKSNKEVVLFFVSSVTIMMLLENVIAMTFSDTVYAYPNFFGKNRFLHLGFLNVDLADVVMLGIAIVALAILVFFIYRTRMGLCIRSLSQDARTSSLMGINVDAVVLATFFVAGVFAALAGVFLGIRTVLSPQLGSMFGIKGFMVCVIGGLGSISGAFVGALLLGITETILITLVGSSLAPVGTFGIMLLFLILRPQGLMGQVQVDKA